MAAGLCDDVPRGADAVPTLHAVTARVKVKIPACMLPQTATPRVLTVAPHRKLNEVDLLREPAVSADPGRVVVPLRAEPRSLA